MKGISQIIAVILILMIGVSMAGVLYVWSQETAFDIYPEEEAEIQYLRQRACIGIQDIDDKVVTINNCGSVPLDNIKIYVNEIVSHTIDPVKFNPSQTQDVTVVNTIVDGDRVYVTSDYAISPVVTYDSSVVPYCPDGKCNGYETCETCPADCGECPPDCGDGVIEGGEACDDGYEDECGTCNADCTGVGSGSVCGDGSICPETEVCDDNNCDDCNPYPGCVSDCTREQYCGNGIPECGEQCDDGNSDNNDECLNNCENAYCGDGVVCTICGEQCDDGNTNDNDACSNGCIINI